MLQRLLDDLKQKNFSKTEIETLLQIASGLSFKESAESRFVTHAAIKYQRNNLAKKLGVGGKYAIIFYVLNFYCPNLKPEILEYLYPSKKNLDPVLWAGKLGND